MPEATARCPGCGAPAAADAVSCEYCGAALATVTCPSCFAPMFVGSRFCSHCGAEATRTQLDDDRSLVCPRCLEDMPAIALGPTHVHECSACGGLWLDPVSMQKLCDAREEHAAVVSALAARIPRSASSPETVRYVPCPSCKKLMNRVNFAKSSGVVIDVCKAHGVWLDRGELERVMGFVESGGLAASRDRERERLVEEQQKLLAMQQDNAATLGQSGITVTTQWGHVRDAPDSPVEHLLRDAIGLFLK